MKIADGEPSPLVAKGICKNYGGAPVLKDVDFSLGRGEIHALLGANGAGKSTLMNILDGVVPSNAGSIFINGIEARITNPEVARQHGIGMVHQELTVLPNITVAENIYINRLPRNRWGIVNWKKLYADTEKVLRSIGLDVNPRTRLGKLSIADRQMVEIGRIMAMDLPILLLDEPTSALSEAEIRRLLELILQFKSEGKSVVFITHKLDEIMAVSDKVTVLRDGKLVDVIDVCERDKKPSTCWSLA
jgi:ribose transport system ATP-binding protein